MPADQVLVSRAALHSRLRWVGVGFFFIAAVIAVGGVGALVTGRATLGILPWCFLALGVSLGSFGTNDDTTLHLLAELGRRGKLPEGHKPELAREHKARGARLSTLHDHPKAAFLMPALAVLALLYASWRVSTAWGLLS